MNILFDSNVILDLLLRREPFFEDAATLSVLSEKGHIQGYMSAAAVTDVFYIARKSLGDKETALGLLKGLLANIRVASVTQGIIYEALDLKWNDFEDAVQYAAGKSISAQFIITRNPSDFSGSTLKVMTPNDFLKQIIK